MTPEPFLTLQDRICAWHRSRWGESSEVDIWKRLAKLTEEVGELNQAITGQDEGRDGRGDPAKEAAQVLVVLFCIAGRHLGVDLLAEVEDEIARLEAKPGRPWEAA